MTAEWIIEAGTVPFFKISQKTSLQGTQRFILKCGGFSKHPPPHETRMSSHLFPEWHPCQVQKRFALAVPILEVYAGMEPWRPIQKKETETISFITNNFWTKLRRPDQSFRHPNNNTNQAQSPPGSQVSVLTDMYIISHHAGKTFLAVGVVLSGVDETAWGSQKARHLENFHSIIAR